MITDERVSLTEAGPESLAAIRQLAESVQEGAIGAGLRPRLLELPRIRASQINGCAFCLALHIRQALDAGEDQRRLDLLAAWREPPPTPQARLESWSATPRRRPRGHPAGPASRTRTGRPLRLRGLRERQRSCRRQARDRPMPSDLGNDLY